MTGQATTKEYPDELSADNKGASTALGNARGWVSLLVLGAFLLAAMLGVFGGWPNSLRTADGPAASLSIEAPRILRSGKLFEFRMRIAAKSAIGKPVLAMPLSYWHDITINTVEPQPASASSERGYILYEFDPMKPGDVIEMKLDGQINPALFSGTGGTFALRDDKAVLVQLPLELRVFP